MCLNINKLYVDNLNLCSMQKISVDLDAENTAIHAPGVKQTRIEITRVLSVV